MSVKILVLSQQLGHLDRVLKIVAIIIIIIIIIIIKTLKR